MTRGGSEIIVIDERMSRGGAIVCLLSAACLMAKPFEGNGMIQAIRSNLPFT